MNNVELFYYLATNQLSNSDYNRLIDIIYKTNNTQVFKTSFKEVKSELFEFLLTDCGEVQVEKKE